MRLDKYLVEEGYFESRNRAHDAIKAGEVTVDGKKAKPSAKVDENSVVDVSQEKFYVSRAARKLESFLEDKAVNFKEKSVLDVGASTGGFSQISLEKGAKSVVCVDVGSDQLHKTLRDDVRVTVCEGTDIRDFVSQEGFDLIVCDISFISILQVVQEIERVAKKEAEVIILYKPQFEVGKDTKRDSRGVVQDIDAINRKREQFEEQVSKMGWKLQYNAKSKVSGKEGNQEYFYLYSLNKS